MTAVMGRLGQNLVKGKAVKERLATTVIICCGFVAL